MNITNNDLILVCLTVLDARSLHDTAMTLIRRKTGLDTPEDSRTTSQTEQNG